MDLNFVLCIKKKINKNKLVQHPAILTSRLDNIIQGCQKILSIRLIMNSRRLWNSHQRHKFLRAETSRDILKLRVLEMAFPGVFKKYFPP